MKEMTLKDKARNRIMEPYFRSKPIHPETWLIEAEGCTVYLLVGDEQGLVIDTGYSAKNIRAYAQSLTDKPVNMVANTHGHFDHTADNGWFDCAYMSEAAAKTANIPYPSLRDRYYKTDYPIVTVTDGFSFELGNRQVEVFDIPAHSSSLAFLDKRERILFSGDEVGPMVNLRDIVQYEKNMQKLMARRSEYDYVCAGHAKEMLFASIVDGVLANEQHILAGNEGEPMQFRGPRPEEKLPVYAMWDPAWDWPRPGDLPHDIKGYEHPQPMGNMRSSVYADVCLNYDADTIKRG